MAATKRKLTPKQKRIVERIRRYHLKGEPLNITAVKRRHPGLIKQVYAIKPFWGWNRALENAGIDYGDIEAELLDTVTCRICGEEFSALFPHLTRTHECEVEDYRLDYPGAYLVSEVHRARLMKRGRKRLLPHWEPVWSPEYVLDRVAAFDQHGFDMNRKAVADRDITAEQAAELFGSWDEALSRVGLDPDSIRVFAPYREWTPELLLRRIKARQKRGLPLNYVSVNKGDKQDVMMIECAVRFFGSWDNALRKCGIDSAGFKNRRPSRYPSADAVVAAVKQRLRDGLAINATALKKGEHRNTALYNSAFRHFGSWGSAVEAAGIDYGTVNQMPRNPYRTKTAVIRELRRRARERLPLTRSELRRGPHKDGSLLVAGARHFGGWTAAIRTAGVWRRMKEEAAR